jgi:two-component system, sensor histidine kinase and response regulator
MDKSKIKVLIAEDDFLIAEEISRSLKNAGYILSGIATNGKKAVELTNSLRPDVILMDIKMPKMDGLEASRIIMEQCPTPVVIVTAHESQDLVEKASEAGIATYLTKPPKPDEIERAITIALARHKDMLESRRLIMELEESRQELHLMNASKDRFFSILAHDLRSPVSALSVFSEQLISNLETLEKHELIEYLSVIHNTSKSLSDLLETLLLWAGFQVNRVDFNKVPVNIFEVVNSVGKLLQAGIQHKSINFTNAVQESVMVYADADMVGTIIRNLVSNAVKFTPAGGNIEILSEEDGEFLIISVRDNGVGISDEDMKKIFKIDKQLSHIGTQGEKGFGLGLLLCKEMVQKNGGEIWVESIPGGGTTFSFTLPMVNE